LFGWRKRGGTVQPSPFVGEGKGGEGKQWGKAVFRDGEKGGEKERRSITIVSAGGERGGGGRRNGKRGKVS